MWGIRSQLTVHLPFVREDDFPPAARRINGQSFLEALLNIRTPDALGIGRSQIFLVLLSQSKIDSVYDAPYIRKEYKKCCIIYIAG